MTSRSRQAAYSSWRILKQVSIVLLDFLFLDIAVSTGLNTAMKTVVKRVNSRSDWQDASQWSEACQIVIDCDAKLWSEMDAKSWSIRMPNRDRFRCHFAVTDLSGKERSYKRRTDLISATMKMTLRLQNRPE